MLGMIRLTSSRGILKQLSIDGGSWQKHISHDTSSDEDILHAGLLCVSKDQAFCSPLIGGHRPDWCRVG